MSLCEQKTILLVKQPKQHLLSMAEYKIKDLEVLAGVKAHTIRIWEKRYGILNPERSDTQIRSYSDSELVQLINICLLNKNGFKISKIATLSKEEIQDRVWSLMGNSKVNDSCEKLLLALIEMNELLFRDTLDHLISEIGLEKTFSQYLIPFLDRIGVMWLVGSIKPAQEHFISNLIRQKIISEIDKQKIPEVTTHPVLLYLPEHEWHEISLLFYHYLLRSQGIFTLYLGQSMPYDSLISCIKDISPSCIITSWLTCVDLDFMRSYFKKLKQDLDGLPIYAGGAQINLNISVVKDLIIEVKSSAELLSHFSDVKPSPFLN